MRLPSDLAPPELWGCRTGWILIVLVNQFPRWSQRVQDIARLLQKDVATMPRQNQQLGKTIINNLIDIVKYSSIKSAPPLVWFKSSPRLPHPLAPTPRPGRPTGAEDLFPHGLRGPHCALQRGAAAERRVPRAPQIDGPWGPWTGEGGSGLKVIWWYGGFLI